MSIPMPPWTCWAVAATRAPASAAQNFAMPAARVAELVLTEEPGGLPHGPPDRLDVDERVGHPLLHGLETPDGSAELLALGRVRGGDAQRPLGDAELDRAQSDECSGMQRLDHLGAVARKPILAGNDCTVEEYVGVRLTVGRCGRPIGDAVCVHVENEQTDVTVIGRGGDQDRMRNLSRRDQLLASVDAPVVAVAARGGRWHGRVRTPGFGQSGSQQAADR